MARKRRAPLNTIKPRTRVFHGQDIAMEPGKVELLEELLAADFYESALILVLRDYS
jgi:hypothetical protein